MQIPEIDVPQAKELHAEGAATFVDIRDDSSYAAGHIPGAVTLDDSSVQAFLRDTDPDARIVVYCYHGNSSLGAAAFFLQQGFENVSSMSGGFEAWHGAGGTVKKP
ncbi:MAG: thiosulfate sulfurtransferase GlpE [Planctomycetota bacterium]|jgi:thiosulfate sulfurtransferase